MKGWDKFISRFMRHPKLMARRNSKLFKQISNVHLEDVTQDLDWSSFLKLEKQDPSMRSAYIDKVRISWILADNEATGDEIGVLFVASHDKELDSTTPGNNDGNVIAASGQRSPGGIATLDLKRRITIDYDGTDTDVLQLLEGTSGAPIYLHCLTTDMNSTISLYLVIETWGRWFSATSL